MLFEVGVFLTDAPRTKSKTIGARPTGIALASILIVVHMSLILKTKGMVLYVRHGYTIFREALFGTSFTLIVL